MTTKFVSVTFVLLLVLSINSGIAEERKKLELLKPVTPCLFFLDEETGEPTGNAANAPCDLGATRVNSGDTVDPALREKYGKAYEAAPKKKQSKRDTTQ